MAVLATEPNATLSELAGSAERIGVLQQLLETAQLEHEHLIHHAVHGGAAISEVAEAARVPAARVRQLARHRPI